MEDIRKFLTLDPESAAGKSLQEKLLRKRQTMCTPIMREKADPKARDSYGYNSRNKE